MRQPSTVCAVASTREGGPIEHAREGDISKSSTHDAPSEDATPGAADQPAGPPPAGHHRTFRSFALDYWRGRGRRQAWLYVIGIAVVMGATLAINFAYNYWNKFFFDALGQKSMPAIWASLMWLPPILILGAACAAATAWLKMRLQSGWRASITRRLLSLWLGEQRYYRLSLAQDSIKNVEHRVAEDVRLAVEPAVELSIGLLWSISSALMFIGVLVTVGGSMTVGGIVIPGYLAMAAVIYAAVISGGVTWIGRTLADAIATKNEREAQFRYELTRVRENAESIAFLRGDVREYRAAKRNFAGIVEASHAMIRGNSAVVSVVNFSAFLAPVVPAILAAPKFMNGELSLGGVMQLVAAFAAVLGALNWIADNFLRLSELKSAVTRSGDLYDALLKLDTYRASDDLATTSDGIELRNVTLRKADGSVLIDRANVVVNPGERVLIEGKSGSGKSTLLRSLAGLWPWADGRMSLPPESKVSFVPQRPYIPIGRLSDALTYPSDIAITQERASELLKLVGLDHLAGRSQEVATWDTTLSGGERQRLAFARVILEQPAVIVLDEATSALDDESQAALFETLVRELPDATILNVAHRAGLQKYHDRKIVIEKGEGASNVASRPTASGSMRAIASKIQRGIGFGRFKN